MCQMCATEEAGEGEGEGEGENEGDKHFVLYRAILFFAPSPIMTARRLQCER